MPLITLQDLINDTKARLNEASNTSAGALSAGTGAADLITTNAQITDYLNDGAADIAKTVYPIYGTATKTALTVGTQYVPFSAFTPATGSGSAIWAVQEVTYNGVVLEQTRSGYISVWYPTNATDVNGLPLYWWATGQQGIALAPKPSASQTLTAIGLLCPTLMVATTDTPTWIEADHLRMLPYYAAAMIARKNIDDKTLEPRIPIWDKMYDDNKTLLAERLVAQDPQIASRYFPQAINRVKLARATGK
jgi:hypothetical protein